MAVNFHSSCRSLHRHSSATISCHLCMRYPCICLQLVLGHPLSSMRNSLRYVHLLNHRHMPLQISVFSLTLLDFTLLDFPLGAPYVGFR